MEQAPGGLGGNLLGGLSPAALRAAEPWRRTVHRTGGRTLGGDRSRQVRETYEHIDRCRCIGHGRAMTDADDHFDWQAFHESEAETDAAIFGLSEREQIERERRIRRTVDLHRAAERVSAN